MKAQFASLLRQRETQKSEYVRKALEVAATRPDVWLQIPGSRSTSNIAKELSESYGMLQHIDKEAQADPREPLIFDLCAGKAFTALLLKSRDAKARVIAIDKTFAKDKPLHDILRELGVELLPLDMLKNDGPRLLDLIISALATTHEEDLLLGLDCNNFSDSSRARRLALQSQMDARLTKGSEFIRRPILVAMHPCGLLADTIISAFLALPASSGAQLVLCPCCSPPSPIPQSHEALCERLFSLVQSSEHIVKSMYVDPGILSAKNTVLIFRLI